MSGLIENIWRLWKLDFVEGWQPKAFCSMDVEVDERAKVVLWKMNLADNIVIDSLFILSNINCNLEINEITCKTLLIKSSFFFINCYLV